MKRASIALVTVLAITNTGYVGLAYANAGKLVQSQILKQEPPKGTLRAGATALVDDGTCGPGKIKKITGGSPGTPRKKECIAKP
ncbi:hypothetical protein LMIY3S_01363 [Labrys miyagiensis]